MQSLVPFLLDALPMAAPGQVWCIFSETVTYSPSDPPSIIWITQFAGSQPRMNQSCGRCCIKRSTRPRADLHGNAVKGPEFARYVDGWVV